MCRRDRFQASVQYACRADGRRAPLRLPAPVRLAADRFQLYLHGGQRLWDYAAAQLILREAGGVSETLDGERVYAITLEKRSVIAAGERALFELWRGWLVGRGEGL
ncbi:inositol monophosphatase family protein [Endothiovibrio diazotrophicus]